MNTLERLAAANPDRVGQAGRWAALDGYEVAVIDMGNAHRWSLSSSFSGSPRFIVAGYADTAADAWQAGADAIDAHRRFNRAIEAILNRSAS